MIHKCRLLTKTLNRQECAIASVAPHLHLLGDTAERKNWAVDVWKGHRVRIALRWNGCFHLDWRTENRGVDGQADKSALYALVDETVFWMLPIENAEKQIGIMGGMNEAFDVIAWWKVVGAGSLRIVPSLLLHDMVDHTRSALVMKSRHRQRDNSKNSAGRCRCEAEGHRERLGWFRERFFPYCTRPEYAAGAIPPASRSGRRASTAIATHRGVAQQPLPKIK